MDNNLTWQQKVWIFGKTFLKASKPFFLYIIMPALSMAFGYTIGHSDMSFEEFFLYGSNFYTAVGMLLTLFFLYRLSKKRGTGFCKDSGLNFTKSQISKLLLFFFFGFFSAVFFSAIISLLPNIGIVESYTESSQTIFKGRDLLFTIITTAITAPIVEEIVFRGYMFNTFSEVYSKKKAILIVSIIFAICHSDFLWMIYAFIMGVVLSYIAVREDNIIFPIAVHIGFNSTSGLTLLINSNQKLWAALFPGKWTFFLYGILGGLVVYILARKYLYCYDVDASENNRNEEIK